MTDAHNIAQVELLPCPNPWCGGHIYDLQHRVPLWRVVCACGVKGPTAYSIEDAAAAWNTRPAPSAVVDALREDFCRSNVETWHQEWVNAKGGQWGDNIAWASALQIADRLDAALANTPKPNAGLVEDIEVLRKLAKEARDAEANCNRVIELLTPEWERFEKRDGSHNTYASRLYADHTSHARTNKRDADALERILSALEGDRP